MSKTNLISIIRDQEVKTNNFLPTKKELVKSSQELVKSIVDSGEHNLKEVYAQSLRLKESLVEIEKGLKTAIGQENFEEFGLKATYRSGGDTVNFKEDDVISDLENKIAARKILIKAALSNEDTIFDSDGVEVPRVSTTPRKSSLSVSF